MSIGDLHMFEDLEALLKQSYLTNVQQANQAYYVLRDFFEEEVGEDKAQDYIDAFCLVFLASDGIISNSEVAFYTDFSIQSYKREALIERFNVLKARKDTMELRKVVDRGPQEVKDAAILLAGLCLVCDKELTEREKEDYLAFRKLLSKA